MEVKERVKALRELMKKNKMDAYIIPSFDAHQSEYVADHYKCRQWISGFTGSAGTAVIEQDDAGLWADGRYFIQAAKQIEGSGIRLFKMAVPGVPTYPEWLSDTLKSGACVGFDGSVFSVDMVRNMEKAFKKKGITLKTDKDLIGEIWQDRPDMPQSNIFTLDVKYAGKSRTEKLNEVREEMKKNEANYYFLTSLDDIAWLLNIRGNDVPCNPVTISNVVVSYDKCYLFIDPAKVPLNVKSELEKDGVELKKYDEIESFLKGLKAEDSVMLDPEKVNKLWYDAIGAKTKVECPNVTTMFKAIKNETEIKNLKECMVTDGVAMVKFLKWLKESVGKETVTEYSAAEKLDGIRMKNKLCVGPSFFTIAGYKANAAMMHYTATKNNTATLKKEAMLLVDSGGQYYNGTTDITRTIVLGKLTEEEKRDYTIVLKSHISLATTRFLYGSTGSDVDIMAREPVWRYGIDYKCGTGHGVGFFLNVHEGPQGMRQTPNDIKLVDGMDITNEPGIYTEGSHGIRTENMMLVVKDIKTEYGQFYKFETITLCPIDTAAVKVDMLTSDELNWLNSYNKNVYEKLSPYLTNDEKLWLAEETKAI